MSRRAIRETWEQAVAIDPTLKVSSRQWTTLGRRQLRAVPFSRELLFSSMRQGEPVLFTDLAVPVRGGQRFGTRPAVFRALTNGLPRDLKVRTRCGPGGNIKRLAMEDLLRRWSSHRACVSVTDLHIRGTRVMRAIDTSRLSAFNLLANAGGSIGEQEMLTMVISSTGTFSDAHTDDPDGSNHCFVGTKLWLVWDTFEGLSRNLEDVERCHVEDRAKFNMAAFLSIPGARWFLVEAGHTLFLPGHLTHKVITLDDYIGVGSFFVMLPSYLRTLIRWTKHTPLWALNAKPDRRLELVDRITHRVIEKIQSLKLAPEDERSRWGLKHLQIAFDEWIATSSANARAALRQSETSSELLACLAQSTGDVELLYA